MTDGTSFCQKCGTALPAGATFCPKCGASVVQGQAQAGAEFRRRGEKSEKREKQEKKEKGEKNEKSERGDITGIVAAGASLIWLGMAFFLEESGYIPRDIWGAYFMLGLGAIFVIEGIFIYATKHYGRGFIIAGGVLMILGFAIIEDRALSHPINFWALMLIVLGVFILVAGIWARRRAPRP